MSYHNQSQHEDVPQAQPSNDSNSNGGGGTTSNTNAAQNHHLIVSHHQSNLGARLPPVDPIYQSLTSNRISSMNGSFSPLSSSNRPHSFEDTVSGLNSYEINSRPRQCQILSPECLPAPTQARVVVADEPSLASTTTTNTAPIYHQAATGSVNYTFEANEPQQQHWNQISHQNYQSPSYCTSVAGAVSTLPSNHMMISHENGPPRHQQQQQQLNHADLISYRSEALTTTMPPSSQHQTSYQQLISPTTTTRYYSLGAPSIVKQKSIDLQMCPMSNVYNQQYSSDQQQAVSFRPKSSSGSFSSHYADKSSSWLPIQFVSPSSSSATQTSDNILHQPHRQQSIMETTTTTATITTASSGSSMSSFNANSSSQNNNSDNNNRVAKASSGDEKTDRSKGQVQQTRRDDDVLSKSAEISSSSFCGYLGQLMLASNVPFAYTIILVAFLITIIAATSIITILTIVLTITGYTAYPLTENTFNTSLAVGIVCASLALVLVTGSLIVWRRHCNAAYYYLDEPQDASRGTNSPQLSVTYDDSEYGSVLVSDWLSHVKKLHADGDIGFAREFEQIQSANQKQNNALTCDHSQLPENKHKNRYINIVAYDHTRVILKPPLGGPKKPGHDYINANFIDGYNKPRAYIGTQGPLVSTFDDYWRMIWEQRVAIIVMITNLQERGRRKCDMYWPKEGTETYGYIQVKLVCEVVMATYTLRTFTVRNLKLKKRTGSDRNVYQYHYTNWPDHGVPDHPLPVLSFVRKSTKSNPPGAGPIICHCSAGCGRSGTYIVIDAMLKQINHKQSINVVDFLKHIRSQRNYLVQTEEQYIFIHDALVEAIESGETEIPIHLIGKYIQSLQMGGGLNDNSVSVGLMSNGATRHLGSNYSLMNGLCHSPANNLSVAANDQQQLISSSNSNLLMGNNAATITTTTAAATNAATTTTTTTTNALQKSSLANSQATTVSRSRSSGQWSQLERQYRLAVSFRVTDFCVVSALKPCNRKKNRTHDLIPLEAHRVHITPKPGADGSDYINATFLMGFNHLREFIITQHPIQETFSDFWQMVYDHNSRTIVLLTQMETTNEMNNNNNNVEFPQFWPQKEDEVDYGSFKVKLIEESTLMKAENGGLIMTRDFIMRSNQDDYELQTRIIHCPGWPECCGPLSAVFDLIQVVHEAAQQQANQNQNHQRTETVTVGQEHEPQNGGPIIVVDKFGGTEAATFAVLTTLFKQINYESGADVYMYAKLAHLRRPAIWPTQDDYLFLYRAIENYATNLLQKQQQQQQSNDSKQAAAASLTAPISLANLHHHQTMTLDRHRAHKSSPSINKSSTMRRNTSSSNQKQNQQHQQQNHQASFVNYQTMPNVAAQISSKHMTVNNNRQHTIGGGELIGAGNKQVQPRYQQHQTLDQNHNTLQYSPALVMQVNNNNNNNLMGVGPNKQMPRGSPYNSAASIGAGSHQHLLAANTTNGRPVAAVSSNQATLNQSNHYSLY